MVFIECVLFDDAVSCKEYAASMIDGWMSVEHYRNDRYCEVETGNIR